jgi:hypothetical protein
VRLVNLDPRWLLKDGRRVGFIFLSPFKRPRSDGSSNPTPWRMTCFVEPTSHEDQETAINAAMADLADADGDFTLAQHCNPGSGWTIAGGIEAASFASLTVTPSLDGSAAGFWHGFITNGEIVGGI